MKPKSTKRVAWRPHPGPQRLFFNCPADFILFGGTKGPGKTDALLVACARDIDKDGYKAILFRRSFPELEREIVLRSYQLFGGIGEYDTRNHRWRFPTPVSPGARLSVGGEAIIEFGYMEQEADVYKYSGAQYARIAFDESTAWNETPVRMMFPCLRSPVPGVRRQILLASNPVGPGYGWHKLIFIVNRLSKKIYNDAVWPSDGRPIGLSTCFIPATVRDNPTLLERDPEYPKRLETLPAPVARALLEGSWDETIYLALDNFSFNVHTIEPIPLPPHSIRIMAIDWGKRDKAVVVWLAADDRFIYAYRDYATRGKDIRPFAYEVIDKCRTPDGKFEPIDSVVLSHECFNDRGMGVTQADQFREVFDQFGIPLWKSDKDPEGRLMLLREYLRTGSIPIRVPGVPDLNDYNYWSKCFNEGSEQDRRAAQLELTRLQRGTYDEGELPKLKIFRPSPDGRYGCPELIKTLPLLVTSIEEPKVLADGQDDHGFDSVTYGLKALVAGGAPSAVSLPVEERYRQLLGGQIPDSNMAAEFAMEEARRQAEGEAEEPVRWRVERWDPYRNFRDDSEPDF